MKTWHVEMAVVAAVLSLVVIASSGGPVEWIGAGAVVLSFGHAQVADRLAEREAARVAPSVDCHRWATRYLVGKESLWLAYFVLHHSWSALAGVGLFLVYSPWRAWWRRRHPVMSDEEIAHTERDRKLAAAGAPSFTSLGAMQARCDRCREAMHAGAIGVHRCRQAEVAS